ncbi:MAG: tetratricopeptide repeat protein [Proteobacteria bacterium]|nr:tetratricopeptide repeat protein [Pseudomonadota bacterium]
MSSRLATALVCAAALWSGTAAPQAIPGCGDLRNSYGPFDYRDGEARALKLPVVEEYHFTPDVESLARGNTGDKAMGDIDYTLRAFPNHPRALQAMARWALRGGAFPNPQIPAAECYFRRAIAFAPDDAAVRLIYGNYLFRIHKQEEAREQYDAALSLDPQSPEINYGAGLLYLQMGELDKAKALAKVAYDGGYPLPGLRNKIRDAEQRGSRGAVGHKPGRKPSKAGAAAKSDQEADKPQG